MAPAVYSSPFDPMIKVAGTAWLTYALIQAVRDYRAGHFSCRNVWRRSEASRSWSRSWCQRWHACPSIMRARASSSGHRFWNRVMPVRGGPPSMRCAPCGGVTRREPRSPILQCRHSSLRMRKKRCHSFERVLKTRHPNPSASEFSTPSSKLRMHPRDSKESHGAVAA